MMTKEEFIDFILKGPKKPVEAAPVPQHSALPEGFDGFDPGDVQPRAESTKSSFARRLLEAAGFELAKLVETKSLIRSADAIVRFLPERAAYWPKTPERPFQTILFEADRTHKDLQAIPAFRHHVIAHLELAEDALARLADEALQGFQKRGQTATADTLLGSATETLCIVSIIDEREAVPARLVCFATYNKHAGGGLETFQIAESVRSWEPQLAHDHLGLLYERQFKKLAGADWQEAFTTTEERQQAGRLLEICMRAPTSHGEILEATRKLLDTIASSFGLSPKPGAKWILDAFQLPPDHDIGMDAEAKKDKFNPFGGMSLRDERKRLLGYLIYPADSAADAAKLSTHLANNNQFHNVLVVYPTTNNTNVELWQGQDRLTGKLRKGHGPKDAAAVVNLLQRFFVVSKARIRSAAKLAQELAYRARYLRRAALTEMERECTLPKGADRPVGTLYKVFDDVLARQSKDEFADAYAQTLTYGLLAARWMSRGGSVAFVTENVQRLLPSTSPFLAELFQRLVALRGANRLRWLIEDLLTLLQRTALKEVFPDDDHDPVIHFYEEFLDVYDTSIRASRGVYYTPEPVVRHIVHEAHHQLKTKFGLRLGLADATSWATLASEQHLTIPAHADQDSPFVQILDPATGTGTFLKHAIELIHDTMMQEWAGPDWAEDRKAAMQKHSDAWKHYVRHSLLPRVNGFELIMAPYIVCHLRLGLLLQELGFIFDEGDRLQVFLTNSLEPGSKKQTSLLLDFVSKESQRACTIKERTPITVLLMNPPYARHSSNFSDWITNLVADYKRGFPELSKPAQGKALSDDYVKFIRLAEHYIETSGYGCISFIANHRFLGNPTFRGMRRRLIESFETIDIIDLDGNSRQHDPASTLTDENIFNIQQGVAIGVLTRTSTFSPPAAVRIQVIHGTRAEKFSLLAATSRPPFQQIQPDQPNYLFSHGNDQGTEGWATFVALPQLMGVYGDPAPGFVTTHDEFAISWSAAEAIGKVDALLGTKSEMEARALFQLCTTDQWSYSDAMRELSEDKSWRSKVARVLYRPFDWRYTVWNEHVNVHRRERATTHLLRGANVALVTVRQVTKGDFAHAIVSRFPTELKLASHDRNSQAFPLWLYDDDGHRRIPNFNPELAARVGVTLTSESDAESLFHAIYAILHSPGYRQRYSTRLRAEFPAVPPMRRGELRRRLSVLGADLVATHLLEPDYPAASWNVSDGPQGAPWRKSRLRCPSGSVQVGPGHPKHQDRRLMLNASVWIEPVTSEEWEFSIGGYSVLKKWLKSRQPQALSRGDLELLCDIIGAIGHTIYLMSAIEQAISEHGGWPGAFVTPAEVKP